MKKQIHLAILSLALSCAGLTLATPASAAPVRPQGPCDVYAKAGDPCVGAHSMTRAMYAAYNGPLYQVLRQSDGKKLDIGVVQPSGNDAGGYANAAAQDAFCANTYCWITTIYDQSGHKNDLTQAPRGAFSGPAMGGFNNVPVADMAPISVMGHKVYGAMILPGMGLREDDQKGVAVDDQAEGQYWVVSGKHYNGGCCFDYGNAETDSHDDDAGTMETTYFGTATSWFHGNPPGPWVMTDQENNLVGCTNPGSASKLCTQLPNMTSRFVTGMAKGEPHHWTSMGGDSQQGALAVMYNGPRVDWGYDPMRKQGAILLGNGGDNSVGSQGTFYEGAVTAAKTFPTDATDQLVQANVVAARYAVQAVSLMPASATNVTGLQTFTPGSSQDVTVSFTNTGDAPATGVKLSLNTPKGWTVVASGNASASSVAPGASVNATFKVTSGAAAFNGDLAANASWTSAGSSMSDMAAEKVRNVPAVKINEFSTQATQPFIELYNASSSAVDLSNWSVTEHATQLAALSDVKVPAGTKLAAHGFYLLGMSNSGLATDSHAGDKTVYVRSTTGISAGDSVSIGTGADAETHKVTTVGTAATASTTLWEPLPEGPIMTVPAGSTNVPVTSVAGFEVGQKIALGHGATYPAVSNMEKYEVATITSVGKQGTLSLTAATATAGSTNLKVMSTANISAGDKIRLDVDSVDHGVEWITVKSVGTQGVRMTLTADAAAGATSIQVRAGGFGPNGGGASPVKAGDQVIIGTPATWQTVTISSANAGGQGSMTLAISPALTAAHVTRENVMYPGTGLELEAPLKFTHSANLPFSDRGTGITFSPATAFAHSSNEPVTALGTGITLDGALTKGHAADAVVHDAAVTTAGYQGTPAPNQWFGGPALSSAAGSIVLRDAGGLVVDSLNYGLAVDPWAGEGFQGNTPTETSGCKAPALGAAGGGGGRALAAVIEPSRSAGRYPDGGDTDSNCRDFHVQSAATLAAASAAGATNIKVAAVEGFRAGQTIMIDSGANVETATIATVGTPGASTTDSAVAAGATSIPVANAFGFRPGQTITIGEGADAETATVAAGGRRGAPAVTIESPLKNAHAAGTQVAGTGITLTSGLGHAHASGASIADNMPTPGAPNKYTASR